MEITLRQALSIESKLRDIKLDHQVHSVRAYNMEFFEGDLYNNQVDLSTKVHDLQELIDARFKLKSLVNLTNFKVGITDLLNKRDYSYSLRELLRDIRTPDNLDAVKHLVGPDNSEVINLSSVSESLYEGSQYEIEELSETLKSLSDEIKDLNFNTKITLTRDIIDPLKKGGYL